MLKLFSKNDRGKFRYHFAHVLAFNMTAVILGHWKPKYIFHDFEKPWLMLLWGGDYKRVQTWHRKHNRHHLEYPDETKIDWEALVIDWESSRFTKSASPLDARGEFWKARDKFNDYKYVRFMRACDKLGV